RRKEEITNPEINKIVLFKNASIQGEIKETLEVLEFNVEKVERLKGLPMVKVTFSNTNDAKRAIQEKNICIGFNVAECEYFVNFKVDQDHISTNAKIIQSCVKRLFPQEEQKRQRCILLLILSDRNLQFQIAECQRFMKDLGKQNVPEIYWVKGYSDVQEDIVAKGARFRAEMDSTKSLDQRRKWHRHPKRFLRAINA
ncbi:hypothetical protein RFI_27506, partial [Reticulomyxa filosa]